MSCQRDKVSLEGRSEEADNEYPGRRTHREVKGIVWWVSVNRGCFLSSVVSSEQQRWRSWRTASAAQTLNPLSGVGTEQIQQLRIWSLMRGRLFLTQTEIQVEFQLSGKRSEIVSAAILNKTKAFFEWEFKCWVIKRNLDDLEEFRIGWYVGWGEPEEMEVVRY